MELEGRKIETLASSRCSIEREGHRHIQGIQSNVGILLVQKYQYSIFTNSAFCNIK